MVQCTFVWWSPYTRLPSVLPDMCLYLCYVRRSVQLNKNKKNETKNKQRKRRRRRRKERIARPTNPIKKNTHLSDNFSETNQPNQEKHSSFRQLQQDQPTQSRKTLIFPTTSARPTNPIKKKTHLSHNFSKTNQPNQEKHSSFRQIRF